MEAAFLRRVTPRRLIAVALRFGPCGAGLHPFPDRLSLSKLERADRTIDLGPLQAGRLPRLLFTKGKRIQLAPAPMLADLQRADTTFRRPPAADQLLLIGRRQLRDHNSWMHNVPRLMKGRNRCTLWMNPTEAARLGLAEGQQVVIQSNAETLEAPLQVTDEIRDGVVSLPHGYGHGRDGTRLTVANANPGVCINDITSHLLLDELSGTSALNGVPVTVQGTNQLGLNGHDEELQVVLSRAASERMTPNPFGHRKPVHRRRSAAPIRVAARAVVRLHYPGMRMHHRRLPERTRHR